MKRSPFPRKKLELSGDCLRSEGLGGWAGPAHRIKARAAWGGQAGPGPVDKDVF